VYLQCKYTLQVLGLASPSGKWPIECPKFDHSIRWQFIVSHPLTRALPGANAREFGSFYPYSMTKLKEVPAVAN
jgi:hypothetical protein